MHETVHRSTHQGFASIREKRLSEDETRSRYELLLSRVEQQLNKR